MRIPIYVAATVAFAALDPETMRGLLAAAASVLLECVPYLAVGVVLGPLLGRYARWATGLFGCGCGPLPGALSLPAAAMTAMLFGSWIALARVAAALAFALANRSREHARGETLLDQLYRLAPSAALCAIVVTVLPRIDDSHIPALALFLAGAAIGAFATPCTLGGIALAASLHAHAPFASYGLLCTTGLPISLWLLHARSSLGKAAPHSSIHACRSRLPEPQSSVRSWVVPAALLLTAIIGAPQPVYRANETTLADLYPGERLSFTGAYERGSLVRYAITCCRADAAPVAVMLASPQRIRDGTWIVADGSIVRRNSQLLLAANRTRIIAPPRDPFIYR